MNLAARFTLNSDTYTEFFLTGEVLKMQRNLYVQNSTLRVHEASKNFPLKSRRL
jgi:hypothetical protein